MKKLLMILFVLALFVNIAIGQDVNRGPGITIVTVKNYTSPDNWFSVADYGVLNDSTLDNTSGINAAHAAASLVGGIVFFPAGWNITASNLTPGLWKIIGPGAKLNFKMGSTGNLLTLSSGSFMDGLAMDGGNYTYDSLTAEGNRTAINVQNVTGVRLFHLNIKGFNEKGIEVSTADYSTMYNCNFSYNYYSIYLASGGEYWKVNTCETRFGKYGIFVGGGNNPIVNCTFENAVYGAWLQQGSNGAHGTFMGCEITHNTSANLWITGLTLPESFIGCQFYSGRVVVINSVTIMFTTCQFGTVDIILNDGGTYVFTACAEVDPVTLTELNTPIISGEQNYTLTAGVASQLDN